METLNIYNIEKIVKTVRKLLKDETLSDGVCLDYFENVHNLYSTKTIKETLKYFEEK